MKVDELEEFIGKFAVGVLKERGITELFPPQSEAISLIFSDRNVLLSMPTAAGKTLLAELAMVRAAIEGGKSLYVTPLRAIASEKFREFKSWEKIGLKVGISTGDYSSTDEHLSDCDIVVTTCEKADSLLRNRASWMRNVSCLVVDELHLIDDAERGPNLEVLIAKMLGRARIVALSATVSNCEEIAEWLNAECYYTEWRPVPLVEGSYVGGTLYLGNKTAKISFDRLVVEGTLIFESTRRNAESTALKLSALGFEGSKELARAVLEENEGEISRKLAECIENGVAFHHAGLLASQREVVESGFRRGEIKVVVATPTLAAGVNLPARRVIVRSIYRHDGYTRRIKVLEYKQMAGRAGRPGCEVGEAIIVAKSKEIAEKYIHGEPEPLTSKLGSEVKIRFHTLSLICDGYSSIGDIERFFERTLFHKQFGRLEYVIERVVYQLERWGMVEIGDKVVPTDLGRLVARLYIDPLTGFIFYDVLSRETPSELGFLHLICRTPDMERIGFSKRDDWIEDEAFRLRNEFTYFPSSYSVDYDWFLREVKTALCLRDWINEVDENVICSKYSVAPGDLRRIVERAEWLSSAAEKIAATLGKSIKMSERIRYGVREELLDLVRLKMVGRVRARRLFNAGIRSVEDLKSKRELAERLIGTKIVARALSELGN
ncbi:MAG: DEAD/DEAH box helicase [Archaeoglobaceae archaeon]